MYAHREVLEHRVANHVQESFGLLVLTHIHIFQNTVRSEHLCGGPRSCYHLCADLISFPTFALTRPWGYYAKVHLRVPLQMQSDGNMCAADLRLRPRCTHLEHRARPGVVGMPKCFQLLQLTCWFRLRFEGAVQQRAFPHTAVRENKGGAKCWMDHLASNARIANHRSP